MKTNNLAILTILIILITSCKNELINERFEVVGYSIGDSISKEFKIDKEYGINFKSLIYIKDTLIKVSTIGNHISYFHIKQPERNYNSTIEKINRTFGLPIQNYIGDTLYGVKLNHRVEYYLWIDSETKNKIETVVKENNANFFEIHLTNDSIVEFIKKRYLNEYNDAEVLIKEFACKSLNESEKIFLNLDSVDLPPTFIYKQNKTVKESLCEFYKDSLIYPTTQDCMGRVYVKFVVEKDKSLSNVFIVRDIPGCDEYNNEALRLVKSMKGLWEPAKKENKKVRFQMTIPVFFSFINCPESE